MLTIEEKLQQLGIILPTCSAPSARYANYVLCNGMLFVSGKGPAGNIRGKVGIEYSTEEGYRFARAAGIEVLAVLREALGSLENVKRVVKIQGFVNAGPEFEEHHLVLDGCSDLMAEIFAERGIHARSVFGANSLRSQLPIIVDCLFEVRSPEEDGEGHGK
jgi:enamine deaminase RidA (YjgF/YER057c/UK114 family)